MASFMIIFGVLIWVVGGLGSFFLWSELGLITGVACLLAALIFGALIYSIGTHLENQDNIIRLLQTIHKDLNPQQNPDTENVEQSASDSASSEV